MTESKTTKIPRLKNCPFCDGGAVLATERDRTNSGTDWGESRARVFCDNCGARTQTLGNNKVAIKIWNTRHAG